MSQEPALPGYKQQQGGVELPKTAEKLLIEEVHAQKIVGISWLAYRRHQRFDYLGMKIEFEVSWGNEGVYHQDLVLRKQTDEPDWSKAVVFITEQNLFHLFAENEQGDLQKGLIPRR